jgi:hypothetical protein
VNFRGCVRHLDVTFRTPNPSIPYLRDPPRKQYPNPSASANKPVIRTQGDSQYRSNEHRYSPRKLLERGVWFVATENRQDLGIPQTDVTDPECERVKRDFEGRPAFSKPDFRKACLTFLDVQFDGCKDLFIVVGFALEK